MPRWIIIISTVFFLALGSPAEAEEAALPALVFRAQVDAPPDAVWSALTTLDGVLSFFAGSATVEPRIGGRYEMYFLLHNPPGLRGGEGVRILAMEAPHRFLISWNAPPSFGPLRDQQTVMEFIIEPLPNDRTLVTATHSG